jgi:hypothetical protein
MLNRGVAEHGPGICVKQESGGKSQGGELLHAELRGQFQPDLFAGTATKSGRLD